MLLHMYFRAYQAHLLLASSAVIMRIGDQFSIVLFFFEIGVGANGCGWCFWWCEFHQPCKQLSQFTHIKILQQLILISTFFCIIHAGEHHQFYSYSYNMGSATTVCQNACENQQQIVVKPGEEIITLTRGQKLQPIVFDSQQKLNEPPSVIEKQKIDINIEDTPHKRHLEAASELNTPKASKLTAAKMSKLNMSDMIVLSPGKKAISHLQDELISVPYSVIRLTITDRLNNVINKLDSEIFSKYQDEQKSSIHWKLHKKGYYIAHLGSDLYAVFTTTFYYQGQLEQTPQAILPVNQGILISQNGIYIGLFEGGKANGKGQFKDVDLESTFRGDWMNGVMVNGVIENMEFKYQGQFQRGVAQGKGKLHFKERALTYTGQFQDGLLHDTNGFLQGPNYIYQGGFQYGRKQGQGCLVQKQQKHKDKKQKYHPPQQYQGKWHHDSFIKQAPSTDSKIRIPRK